MAKTTLASLEKRIKSLEASVDSIKFGAENIANMLLETDDYWQFHDQLKKAAQAVNEVVPDAL